jgi:HPt (histidine-containing phosphotransfer) domain-containing protein
MSARLYDILRDAMTMSTSAWRLALGQTVMINSTDPSPPLSPSPSIIGDGADEPAIDLTQLSRMTLGDRKLEREVLTLFDRQADLLLARMREVAPAGVATLAHTLKGSALGVGATRVAAAAEALERAVAETTNLVPALSAVAAAVAEARASIDAMLKVSLFV